MGRASWAEGSKSLQDRLTGSLSGAPSRWGWRSLGQESKLYGRRLVGQVDNGQELGLGPVDDEDPLKRGN